MDAVVDPRFAIAYSKLGGIAVLNLDGVQTRYDNPDEVLDRIAAASLTDVDRDHPARLPAAGPRGPHRARVEEIKRGGGVADRQHARPQNTKRFAPIAIEAGAEYFVVQSTVTTARHVSRSLKGLRLDELVKQLDRRSGHRRQHRRLRRRRSS